MSDIENDYMYLKLSKVKNLINIILVIATILCIAYFFRPLTAFYLPIIIETILVFSITFIATTVFKFSNKKIFKLISMYLLLIAILKFISLVYLMFFFGEKEIIQCLNLKILAICNVLESIYCFMIIVYVKYVNLNMKLIVVFFTIISLVSICLFDVIVFGVISTVLLLLILYLLKDFKIFKNNLLNYLKLFIIINLSLVLIYALVYIFNLEALLLLIYILKILIYLIIYVWISEMLITKPYKILHQDIIDKNKKLKILNKKMEESNNEFKEFKEKLKDNETYFKNFINNAPMSIVILNNHNYRIFSINKQFSNELNLKNNRQVINRNLFKIINIENKDEFLITKKGEASYSSGKIDIFWQLNILLQTKDYLIISMKNITEFKFSEKIKFDLGKRKLSEKIKNDFLSSISHDLKTPINVIYSSVQVQEKFYVDENINKIGHYNQVNKENCITLMRLANNLIDSSKIDYDYLKPNFKVYNIVTLVEDSILNLAEYIKEKKLTYIFDTDEEELYVKCDQEFIQRIILNLISNSIKYTKRGGIRVQIKSNRNKVIIDFTDTGEGMDKDFIEKAFLRYSKGNKKGIKNKSTGIGLYIVKSLVELQNGTIYINSIKDAGTNVRLEFSREKNCGIQSGI
ncbi:TPA: HAMP domain-containing histidine kinase [Clostridium perfringens]|uniref:sensor histidine kinase n=1 Tax=Clostridium perfringens TaxID=1502 RepID=UPI001A28E215|nr:HAMP domain-containing sensor histidine kinase [Clostridium perfringens]WFB44191.1 HAMP domain-containing sensor histidine kinase [Clostridium perfringens]WFD75759.1 HAMP domain-containing sensor histidine kinase [Clostridium perfringens]WFD84309.1 HAMP domain-containing sensor histidine kinase [Clostridium perfringens]WFD97126.1 HAMP domain-containing sensor histidine kinase [Clostridium perfringens]HAT4185319.1 HAMP domain-containing histidine kinase [Clostridium perfringens]